MDKGKSTIEHTTFSFNEGIYVVSKHGYVTYMNSEAERLLGQTKKELVNKKIKLFDKINYQIIDGTTTCFNNESIENNKHLSIYKDGHLFSVKYEVYPFIKNNEFYGVIIVFRDNNV